MSKFIPGPEFAAHGLILKTKDAVAHETVRIYRRPGKREWAFIAGDGEDADAYEELGPGPVSSLHVWTNYVAYRLALGYAKFIRVIVEGGGDATKYSGTYQAYPGAATEMLRYGLITKSDISDAKKDGKADRIAY